MKSAQRQRPWYIEVHSHRVRDLLNSWFHFEFSMNPVLAIVGATGAVGELMCQVVLERGIKFESIRFIASERSAGKKIKFAGESNTIQPLSKKAFEGIHFVLSSTPASVSREWSPVAVSAGAIVIDNSSAWRMDPDVPLVVPEVNSNALENIPKGIVANPNCSTIQMVVALKPLHDFAKIKRVIVSTYQASSGKGATGLADLDSQIKAIGQGIAVPPPLAHIEQLAGNVLAHDWKPGDEGFSEEEWKIVRETKKIMGDDSIAVNATTVRVPVRTGHSESINIEFERPISVDKATDILSRAPGIVLIDGTGKQEAPTPINCEGRDEVFVGRIRKDSTIQNGLNLWVVADNLRKGAATNAVQIAEILIASGKFNFLK